MLKDILKGKVVIVGIGNTLKGDDGFGPAVIEQLRETPLPDGVAAVDGGTAGVGLAALYTVAIWKIELPA